MSGNNKVRLSEYPLYCSREGDHIDIEMNKVAAVGVKGEKSFLLQAFNEGHGVVFQQRVSLASYATIRNKLFEESEVTRVRLNTLLLNGFSEDAKREVTTFHMNVGNACEELTRGKWAARYAGQS